MQPLGEDVRCVWLGTLNSRSLLQKTRRIGSRGNEEADLALTTDVRPLFLEAARGTGLIEEPPSVSQCHILGAVALRPRERFSYRESEAFGDGVRQQITHFTTLAGRPLDKLALLFEIVDAVMLQRPVTWFTIAGRRGGAFMTELESGQEQRLRAAWPLDGVHAAFAYPFSQVLRMPFPYVVLFLKRAWRMVVVPDLAVPWNYDAYGVQKGRKFVSGLTGSQRKRTSAWPALRRFGKRPRMEEAEAAHAAAAGKQVDSIHDDARLWGLADCVASLGRRGMAVDPEIWQDFVEGMRYQHSESLLLAAKRHAYVAGKPSFAFRVGHLVEAMLCSMSLSHDDDLGQALQLAACLRLPDKLAKAWIERLHEDPGRYMPSKAIMSQRRAALDMGYALLQQASIKSKLEQGAFFYALTDS